MKKERREPVGILLIPLFHVLFLNPQFVAKKQDVLGIFTNRFQQQFNLLVVSVGAKTNVELRKFYNNIYCNCHTAGTNNEG